MNVMTVQEALAIALKFHGDQVDKRGEPYILHPIRVMLSVPPRLRPAAVLHDVLEDTDCKPSDIYDVGTIYDVELIEALTRRVDETYEAYLVRLKAFGPDAVTIKMADLRDNTSPGRVLPELAEKYERAKRFLMES